MREGHGCFWRKTSQRRLQLRTKARDSEDKGQRQDVLGVVQDRKEAGVTGAGMGGGRRSGWRWGQRMGRGHFRKGPVDRS